ncbi:MAG: Eco57I restriction-modification methylase domain-containing protein [Candidatus Thorarchaeota archaeon]
MFANQALAILKDVESQVEHSSADWSRSVRSEVIRILSLERIIKEWTGTSQNATEDLTFRQLSPTGFRNSVEEETVRNIAMGLIPRLRFKYDSRVIRNKTILELADLLGSVHSIGSHVFSPKGNSTKKMTGAFYTPSNIARFISKKTLIPRLTEIVSSSQDDVETLLKKLGELQFLDPCCGPGIFLLSALDVVYSFLANVLPGLSSKNESTHESILNLMSRNMHGVDLDIAALEIARVCFSLMRKRKPTANFNNFQSGNSIISLKGLTGDKDHSGFFTSHHTRAVFEWSDAFNDILNNGGFDFILFNPPYERLKPNLAEFVRSMLRTGLSNIDMKEYESYRTLMSEEIDYFKHSGEFEYSASNSINTYQLFIERSLQLAKEGGRIGFIVPSTLLGDFSSKSLRRHLISQNSLESIDSFSEAAQLFPGVTQSVCIAIVVKHGSTEEILFRPNMPSLQTAATKSSYRMTSQQIRSIFGDTYVIPEIASQDWRILGKLHKHPPLSSYDLIHNHRGELDLTLDKKFLSGSPSAHPLIRGLNIRRYSLDFGKGGKKQQFVDLGAFMESRPDSNRMKHISQRRIICQQVSNRSQRWRLKFAKAEKGSVLANSCNYICISSGKPEDMLDYLAGVLNSELLNWRFSISNTNNHVSNRELGMLPIVDTFCNGHNVNMQGIVKLARDAFLEGHSNHPELEASIFELYDLSRADAKRILNLRNASQELISSILGYIK